MISSHPRIALAQYSLQNHKSFAAWRDNISSWVGDAVANDSQLLVFPEYCSTDLAGVANPSGHANANDLILDVQKYHDDYLGVFSDLASKHRVYIVAGTFACREGDKHFNRSYFVGPNGKYAHQDKLILTRFEREKTFLSAGEDITIFETEFGKSGIAVCFDVQHPLIIRKLSEAGCNLLIVPSCTGSMAGYNRVKIGCQARALESQMAVVHSVTVGDASWQPIADTNHGAAAIFAPPDSGFPETGIIASGDIDQPGWVYANLDFSAYLDVRENGHVLNWKTWREQESILPRPIKHANL